MRGLNLLRIRIDEEAGKYSRLSQTSYRGSHDGNVFFYVETALGSYLVRGFRNQRDSVRPCFESHLQHLFGCRHLQIQISRNTGAQRQQISILNVTAIFP